MFLLLGLVGRYAHTEVCSHYYCYISSAPSQKMDLTTCTELDSVAVVWQEANYSLLIQLVNWDPNPPPHTHTHPLGQVPSEQVFPNTLSYWGCALNAHSFAGYLISQVADRTETSLSRNMAAV